MLIKPKTELQKAMYEFEKEIAADLLEKYDVRDTVVVGAVIDCLVDLRTAESALKAAARKKSVKPGVMKAFRDDVRVHQEQLDECIDGYLEYDDWNEEQVLKESKAVLRKILKFAKERLPLLLVDEDVDFIKTPESYTSDSFTTAFCHVVCYDKSIPKSVRGLIPGIAESVCVPCTRKRQKIARE